jgi:hypothetical protein
MSDGDKISSFLILMLFAALFAYCINVTNVPKNPYIKPETSPYARPRRKYKRACKKHSKLLPAGTLALIDEAGCDYCKSPSIGPKTA